MFHNPVKHTSTYQPCISQCERAFGFFRTWTLNKAPFMSSTSLSVTRESIKGTCSDVNASSDKHGLLFSPIPILREGLDTCSYREFRLQFLSMHYLFISSSIVESLISSRYHSS